MLLFKIRMNVDCTVLIREHQTGTAVMFWECVFVDVEPNRFVNL